MLCVPSGPDKAQEAYLSVKQVATLLGVSTDSIYQRVRTNAPDLIPCTRLGARILFRWSEVQLDLDSRRRAGSSGSLAAANEVTGINGKERNLTRRRYQTGSVRLRTDSSSFWWEGFYREDVRQADGEVVRRQRTINLGRKSEIPTKRLALRKLSEKLIEINDPQYRPDSEITLNDFLPKFKQLKLATKKDTTRQGYESVFRAHLQPAFGDWRLSEIQEEDVQRFINRKLLDLSWNSVKNMKWVLSSIFTAAKKYRYVKHNPVREVELPSEPVRQMEQLPTLDQLQRLLQSLEEELRFMVWLDCITGARPSELLGLRRRAVDFQRNCIWIVEAVNNGRIHTPKSHRSNRPIQLTEEDMLRVRTFMKRRPSAGPEDWLFPSERTDGPKQYASIMTKKIQPMAKELGLPHMTWRLFRHWHATLLGDAKVPIKATQERMGHSRAEITMKYYTHLTSAAAELAAATASLALKKEVMD
jgi:integrase